MKKRAKILTAISAIICLAVSVLIMISLDAGSAKPPFSAFNYDKKGAGLIYDTLSLMNYPIKTGFHKVTGSSNINDVQIFIEPAPSYFSSRDEDALIEWVKRGGRLIYFANTENIRSGLPGKLERDYSAYVIEGFALVEVGFGEVLVGAAEAITNESLLSERWSGYILQSQLDYWGYENIYINENCHGFSGEPNLWRSLPLGIRMFALQLGIVTVAVIAGIGKRFGRPMPYYEESEREENEYLIALSNIYEKSGTGYALFDMYFNHFICKCVRYFHIEADSGSPKDARERAYGAWRENNFPHAEYFAELCGITPEELNTKRKSGVKAFNDNFRKINALNRCLNYR